MDLYDEEGLRTRSITKQTLKAIVTKRPVVSPIKNEVNNHGHSDGGIPAEEEFPLSPLARVFHEPHSNCYIIAMMGSKKRIDPQVVKRGLVHTLLKHPRFSSVQVKVGNDGKEMKWVRSEVDLDNHVIVPDVDPNMDSPQQYIDDYVSNLSKTTIHMSKPLWELHLLNVKTSEAEAVGVFRIHHSLGDGTSLMSLLLACTRQTANPEALPTIPVTKKSVGLKSSRSVWGSIMTIWAFLTLVWNTLVDILMFVATLMFLMDTKTPVKRGPGIEFTPKRFVHRTVSLDDMKLVKNAMNMTINDVALGVTSAGLSRYLNRRYGEYKNDEGATEKRNNLPKNVRLRSTLFINIRPSHGIQALADMMEKNNTDAKWGNWLGYVLLPFTIALRDNPLDYVREAKATIDRKKHSWEALYTFYGAKLILKCFGIKAASSEFHNILTRTTMSFSNVVGPREEIGFHSHSLAYLAPTFYGLPQGLSINFQSYMDRMSIVLAVDENLVPNPHQLLDDLEESLKLIKDAVVKESMMMRNGFMAKG